MFIVNPYIFSAGSSYLIDTYSPVAAYSLRKLSSSATVAIRVRRSSDNAEQDIGFSGNGLDTASLSSFVGANSATIVTWYDQAGSNDVTQATASSQPRIVNAGTIDTKNGKTSILYDGTNDFLTRSNLTALNSYPFSVFAVGGNESGVQLAPAVSQRNTAGDNSGFSMFFDRTASAIGVSIDQGASNALFNYPSQLNSNTQRIQSFCISSGGDGELWLNGTSQESIAGVSAYATALTANLNFGKQDVGPLDSLMDIQEVIIFNSDESVNQSAIETNINSYYSAY